MESTQNTTRLTNGDIRYALNSLRRLDGLRDENSRTRLDRTAKLRILRLLDILEPIERRTQRLIQDEIHKHADKEADGGFRYKATPTGREVIIEDHLAFQRAVEDILELTADGLPDELPELTEEMLEPALPFLAAQELRWLAPVYRPEEAPEEG